MNIFYKKGNSCVDHGTNPGKCKLENDCLQQRNHKVCGYYRLQKIVCCASENKNTLNRNTFTSAQLSTKRHKSKNSQSRIIQQKYVII